MLLDTSGLLCLFRRAEPLHQLAVQTYRSATRRFTHNYVLTEFVTLAQSRGVPREKALEVLADLAANTDIEIRWVDQELHRAGIALLQARLDKDYSLCDAVSFVLMRERAVSEALTTDRHFEQEGFRRILK